MTRFRILMIPAILALSPAAHAQDGGVPAQAFDRIAQADLNHDGVIDRSEVHAARLSAWPRMDRNGDGYFDINDVPPMFQSRWKSGRAQALLTEFDKNGDGRVSRDEFLNGPMVMFDLIDTNHDGRISREELAAAKAKYHGQ